MENYGKGARKMVWSILEGYAEPARKSYVLPELFLSMLNSRFSQSCTFPIALYLCKLYIYSYIHVFTCACLCSRNTTCLWSPVKENHCVRCWEHKRWTKQRQVLHVWSLWSERVSRHKKDNNLPTCNHKLWGQRKLIKVHCSSKFRFKLI